MSVGSRVGRSFVDSDFSQLTITPSTSTKPPRVQQNRIKRLSKLANVVVIKHKAQEIDDFTGDTVTILSLPSLDVLEPRPMPEWHEACLRKHFERESPTSAIQMF
eukprot:4191784-Amphidinium_carterae.1